jgi:hypothetical protein
VVPGSLGHRIRVCESLPVYLSCAVGLRPSVLYGQSKLLAYIFKTTLTLEQQAWVLCFELVNILTEFMLIIIPALNISRMPTTWEKKLVAISFFSARILYVVGTRVEIPANNLLVSYLPRLLELCTGSGAILPITQHTTYTRSQSALC